MIITIGREFGSGGRELGKRLAEALGIAYYDKEIVTEVSKNTDSAYEYVQNIIDKRPIVYYPISIGHSFEDYNSYIATQHYAIQSEQENVIKDLASKADCVIVGRCADYILRDLNPFRIFVYADMEVKIQRCIEKGEVDTSLNERKIKKQIKQIDRQRAEYYEFYTGLSWGDKANYDLMINTTHQQIKEIALGLAETIRQANARLGK